MAKPRVSVQITADSTGYTAAVNKAKGQLIEFQNTSKAVSHSAITDVQATSGALRILDGGIQNNIRSAERFLANIKGVGAAMQLIYPAVGLIAVGAILVKGVATLTEFIKKTKEAGAEFRASFQEMQNSARLSNDELAKTNINLENQIAKLTGKHENVLASQLIEARIEADNLATSAAHAAKEMKDLLDKNASGILQNVFLNKGVTTDVFGNINNFQNLKKQARQDQDDALHNGDKKGADAANARYQQTLKNERAYLLDQRKQRTGNVTTTNQYGQAVTQSYAHAYGNQDKNLDAINATLSLNYDQSDRTELDAQHAKDSKGLQTAQDAKNVADKAAAAQKKADEDHLKSLQDAFELQKNAAAMQPWETKTNFEQRQRLSQSNFYLGHLNDFKTSDTRRQAFDLGMKPLDEYNTTDTEGRAALQKMLAGQGSSAGIFAGLGSDKDTQARLKAQQEAVSAQSELSNKLRESAISQELQNGAISKYDAAVQMAALHTEAYQIQLEKLQAEVQRIDNDPDLNEEQRRTKLIGIGSQIGQLGQQKDAQTKQDQHGIAATTALGSLNEALSKLVQNSKDATSWVSDFMGGVASANDEIVKELTTKHNYGASRQWSNVGAGVFRGVAKTGLEKGEGALLGAFGIGKPDGTASKPLHVIIAGAKGVAGAAKSATDEVSKASSGIGGFLGKLFGKGSSSATSDGSSGSSGIMGTIGSIASIFGGFFADGGQPPVGVPSMVGEAGPELFVPRTAGTVIPNHALGGSNDTHFHPGSIVIHGNPDQSQLATIRREIAKAVPSNAAVAMHAQRESNARKAPSARS